ncbi:hypothetical protein B0H16DRAFT_1730133 [Mycena metata]|uniref:Uncharacterized protein n=1 Tax=Mycena metata TaxID=1033252 RepID=A0AAD7I9F4_9AGAR|nr:hypothetical protein B0H16DRAFT_1730133 [Mycena metata]
MSLVAGLTGRDGTPLTGPVRAVKTATASIPKAYLLGNKLKNFISERAQKKKDLSDTRLSPKGHNTRVPERGLTGRCTDYETRPRKMAEMARDYHDSAQDVNRPDSCAKMLATSIVLENCQAHVSESQYAKLNEGLQVWKMLLPR